MREHLGYLDGWRGVAILLVLAEHFFGIPFINEGRLGVDVFFVLSGLLMSRILYEERVPLPTFYKRRMSRILPAFLLFVGVLFATQNLTGWSLPWPEFLATATFLRSYIPGDPHIWASAAPIGHIWSLNVEEHAYIIMGLLTLPLILRRVEWIFLMLLAAFCLLTWVTYVETLVPDHYTGRTECAAAFIFFSAGYAQFKRKLGWKMPWMLTVLAAGLGAACYIESAPWWARLLSVFFLGYAVNHLGELPSQLRTALSFPVLRWFGVWSFSLYLWQQPFYVLAKQGGAVEKVAMLACAIGAGLASYYLVERPARRMLNSWRWGREPIPT